MAADGAGCSFPVTALLCRLTDAICRLVRISMYPAGALLDCLLSRAGKFQTVFPILPNGEVLFE